MKSLPFAARDGHREPSQSSRSRVRRRALAALLCAGMLASCDRQPVSPAGSRAAGPGDRVHPSLATVNRDAYGVAVGQLGQPGPASADSVKNAGIGWVRVDFAWNAIQPAGPGALDLYSVDNTVTYASERGIKILGTLVFTPQWANPAAGGAAAYGPPADSMDWARFVHALVTQYRGKVHAWSVWNEPLPQPCPSGFWSGTPQQYDLLYRVASREIKAADPAAQVVLGELPFGPKLCSAGTVTEAQEGGWLTDRVNNAHAAGVAVDAVSLHFYGYGFDADAAMQRVHAVLPNESLWLTETGNTVGDHGVGQADHLLEVLRGQGRSSTWWKKTFINHLYADSANNDFGILAGTSLVPYDAYHVYRLIGHGCTSDFAPGTNANCTTMYRWWKNADAMFGSDPQEGNSTGYLSEGVGFRIAKRAFSSHMVGLYRCHASSTGQHLLTTSTSCEGASGWVKDNGGLPYGYVVATDSYVAGSTMVPLYRLWYPNGEHLFTINGSEKTSLLANGWYSEGITGYVWE